MDFGKLDAKLEKKNVKIQYGEHSSSYEKTLGTVRPITKKSFFISLSNDLTPEQHDWVVFHEKGHIYLEHYKDWYDRDSMNAAIEAMSSDLKKKYRRESWPKFVFFTLRNTCADIEVHTKLVDDITAMKKAFCNTRVHEPSIYGLEPGLNAIDYLKLFTEGWKKYGRVFRSTFCEYFLKKSYV